MVTASRSVVPEKISSTARITAVDVRLSFRSKREFFRFEPTADKPRFVKGLTDRTR